MIGVDTNVLVRFLVEDDAEQTARARAFLQRSVEAETPVFVSDVVLCEVVWVLQSSYRLARPEISATLRDLTRARHLVFSSSDRIVRALEAFEAGKGDFADYLIREQALAAGCREVATFDADLHGDPGFVSP